ncbi:MAG: restriction endonuclease subunit S [Deltaproteobacteria bacterium]|nr:restriction endonuclease subunit S [Deltaproteobacteria bacterium]
MVETGDIRVDKIMPHLFESWATLLFEECLENKSIKFKKLKKKEIKPKGQYPVIDQGEKFITGYVDDESDVYAGTLPVIIFGDHTRRIKYVDFKFAVGADGTKLLHPFEYLHPKFFYFYLNALNLESQGYSRHYRFLKEIAVPIPSLNEQHRIVAKLEKLLQKVDACKERLDKIPTILKRFRQSILAAACSGRLTADWREEHDIEGEWPICQLGALFTMRNGKSLTVKKRKGGEIPVYGGNGMMGTHEQGNTKGQVVVIGRVGAQCGNVHFVSGIVWVTDNAISLQAKQEIVPEFYAYFLKAKHLNMLSGGTGQPYLSQEILAPIETPLPSLDEQLEIVRCVEALFKIADQIEERYKKARAYVDKLTQSILAKAFRGELVPQNLNDEPASELLQRIKEERSKSESNGYAGRIKRKRK